MNPVRIEQVLESLVQHPRSVALDGALSSSEAFLAHVARVYSAVVGSKAERVALWVENRCEFAASLYGCLLAGVETVLPADTLPHTLQALEARCDAFVGPFARALPLPPSGVLPSRLEIASEVVVTVFTSGSTGTPTPIVKRLRQLSSEISSHVETFRQSTDVVVHSTVSHQHIYGLLFTVLWPLAAGYRLSAHRLEYPEQLEPALREGPGVLITSPAHLKRLRDDVDWHLPNLKAVFSSGGPLPEEGARRSRKTLGCAPIEVFGSSETGGIAFRTRHEGSLAAWEPFSRVEWRANADGALEVRSPHLPDLQWFTTADQVRDAGGGSFTLIGRADRIAKIEEKRVSLTAIEQRLSAGGLVSEARAVVIDGLRVTVGVVAVPTGEGHALLSKSKKVLVDALKHQLADTVERVALPRRFRFVAEFPVNSQGKTTDAAVSEVLAPLRPDVTWLERHENRAVLQFEVDPALRVLEGHFPETPIVPGVAQLSWAASWAAEVFGCSALTRKVDALKFQALMLPGQRIQLDLEWNRDKSVFTFRYTRNGSGVSSGKVTCT